MNREILFRGKRTDNGEWVYGDFSLQNFIDKPMIFVTCNEDHPVDPDTVGQFTGLHDKNGARIFEGDILRILEVYDEKEKEYLSPVVWEDGCFLTKSKGLDYYDTFLAQWFGDPMNSNPLYEIEAIGTIHDAPKAPDHD